MGNLTDPAGASGYTTWIANNPVDAYAVGIGTGIANTGPLNSIPATSTPMATAWIDSDHRARPQRSGLCAVCLPCRPLTVAAW